MWMRVLTLIVASLNLFLGARALLELLGVLNSSKYATSTTALFAVLALGLGGACLWFAFVARNPRLGLTLAVGPWVIGLLVVFVSLVTSPKR